MLWGLPSVLHQFLIPRWLWKFLLSYTYLFEYSILSVIVRLEQLSFQIIRNTQAIPGWSYLLEDIEAHL